MRQRQPMTTRRGLLAGIVPACAGTLLTAAIAACSGQPGSANSEPIVGTWKNASDNNYLVCEQDGSVTGFLGDGSWKRDDNMPTVHADDMEWTVYDLDTDLFADYESIWGQTFLLVSGNDACMAFEKGMTSANLDEIDSTGEMPQDQAATSLRFERVTDD